MKKILVPVDFSEYSYNALEAAAYIAKVKEMEIKIYHAMEDSYTPYVNMTGMGLVEDSSMFNYRKELQENVKAQLVTLAEKYRQRGLNVDFEIAMDKPYKSVLNAVNDSDIDLVAVGSHGHSDMEDIFIGSNAEKIIRLSPVPVLSVNRIRENYRIDRIVFASDFEEPEIERILQRVIKFAEIFMAELFLVRVNTAGKKSGAEKSRKRLEEMAQKFSLSAGAVTSYPDRSEEEGILNYAKEVKADLISLCTHGRTGLARLFRSSIAEEVAGYSEIPVLTYNIAKDKIARSAQPITKERIGQRDTTDRIGSSK